MPVLLLLSFLLETIMAAKAVAPRQSVSPWPLPLPPGNSQLREVAEKAGAARTFQIWASLAATELGDQAAGDSGSFTLFTVDDDTWTSLLPGQRADPLAKDPVLQRLVLATQLVAGQVDLSEAVKVRTVGGRTLVITLEEGGGMKVNGMAVKQVLRAGGAQLCVLERVLFIRPEDIEIAVERAEGKAT